MDRNAIWNGDWRTLPQKCGGSPEVWDQTIGCPECNMNLWNLPEYGHWPAWDIANEPPDEWYLRCKLSGTNQYAPYFALFDKLHPFMFGQCHDPGDEDPNSHP